jgi:hypothetical protein
MSISNRVGRIVLLLAGEALTTDGNDLPLSGAPDR